MNHALAPSTIISAAVVMQLFLVLIAGLGGYLIDREERSASRFYENPAHVGRQAWVIVAFAIVTLGLLVLSDGFAGSWIALSTPTLISLIGWSRALLIVFLADIFWTFILVWQTAGTDHSPFTALYFVLPAFAFFLRESPKRVLVYVLCVAICFTIGFFLQESEERRPNRFPFWVVSMLCLGLSLMIGYLTRVR